MRKTLAVLVLILAAALAWPQHGTTPGTSHGKPGLGETAAATDLYASTEYADATAIYDFNSPGNGMGLGLNGGDRFTGTSTHFTAASSEAAYINDNTSVSQGTNQDFGFCLWTVTGTVVDATSSYLLAKTQVEYYLAEDTANKFQFSVTDSVSGTTSVQWGSAETDNTRYFICGWYTSSDGFANISVNAGTPVKDASGPISIPVDGTNAFVVGARTSGGSNPYDGTIGPVWYYKGAVPPYSDLYNSGRGYTCAGSVAAGLDTSLESCWDMEEDGGPYADDVGSNTLTGVNTPTQVLGLTIEDRGGDTSLYLTEANSPVATGGALGYSTHVDGTGQYASVADTSSLPVGNTDYTIIVWVDLTTYENGTFLVSKYQTFTGNAVEYYVQANTACGTNGWRFYISNGTAANDSICFGSDVGVGRHMFEVRHVGSTDFIAINVDQGTEASKTSAASGFDGTGDFDVATTHFNAGIQNITGNIGPVMTFASSDIGAAARAAIYNSGKGATCEAISSAGYEGQSCWNMDEDGGPYSDSWGSVELAATGTPTRSPALVEQSGSGSGMGLLLTSAGSKYLEATVTGLSKTQFTMSAWALANTSLVGTDPIFAIYSGRAVMSASFTTGTDNLVFSWYDGAWQSSNLAWADIVGQNEWHHVALRFDTVGGTADWCLDGVLKPNVANSPDDPLNTTTELVQIGKNSTTYADWVVDDVAYFDGVVKDDQWCSDVYNSGAGVFYAAIMDFMFDKPTFPWSQKPEIVRVSRR